MCGESKIQNNDAAFRSDFYVEGFQVAMQNSGRMKAGNGIGQLSQGRGQSRGVIVASDTLAPTLTIISPAAGDVLGGRNTGFTAAASDASGIRSVAFYVDTTLLATVTAPPYSVNINTRKLAAGAHVLRARATDGAGNVTEQSIAVTVK